jgi:L1 cell adhesion molecule like protein
LLQVDALVDGTDFSMKLTRSRFEALCGDAFQRSMASVEHVLKDAGGGDANKVKVDDVVLVGGSTRIPFIQKLIKKRFDLEPSRSINADEAVAFGAAVQAAMLSGVAGDTFDDILLVDVTPLSLGLETKGGLFTKIIARNASIPRKETREFSTAADNQTGVHIQVYQGEREFARDNHLLGKFDLSGISPARRGVPRIQVTYDLDANGILDVSATDSGSGKSEAITITNDKGRLSADDIAKMVNDADEFREEDEANRTKTEARNQLEHACYGFKTEVEEPGSEEQQEVSEEDKAQVQKEADEVLEWLDANPSASVEEIEEKLHELEGKCNPIIVKLRSKTPGGDEAGGSKFYEH